jgi:hypothetical protein
MTFADRPTARWDRLKYSDGKAGRLTYSLLILSSCNRFDCL